MALDLVVEAEDGLHAAGHVGVERGALAAAEGVQRRQRVLQRRRDLRPLLLGDGLLLAALEHVREAENRLQVLLLRHGDADLAADGVDLTEVVLHQLGVDLARGGAGLRLEAQQDVHRAALKRVGEGFADLQLLVLRQEGGFDIDVAAFAVQGAYFERETPGGKLGDTFAVAGHGLNHLQVSFLLRKFTDLFVILRVQENRDLWKRTRRNSISSRRSSKTT